MSDPDLDLLRRFVRDHAQDAFTEIVRRHVNLVYSAALRQVRSPQLAEDVAQSVFCDLARNANRLCAPGGSLILTAWLYQVTHHTAVDVVRKESRRQLREQIAAELNAMNAESANWNQIEPFLDEAMQELDPADRTAILLRYFENKSLRELGEELGVSNDAAQKRVSRAVERLREFFSKRKVTIGASGLVTIVSANAVQAAPTGLAATISTAVALTGTTVATSTVVAATKTLVMTTLQKTIIAATVAMLAGAGVYEAHQAAKLRIQNRMLQEETAPLAEQIQSLQRERDEATNELAGLISENAKLRSGSNEGQILKLRGQVGVLRTQLAEKKNHENQSTQPPLPSAREYLKRAQRHSMNHEYEEELDDLNKAIELNPNMAEAYLERGNLYACDLPRNRGGEAKAISDYTRCLEIDPNNAAARWNRATYYPSWGKYDKAIADWTTYINGNTDFSHQGEGKTKAIAGAHFWRGHVYQMNLKDYSKAIADYSAAIRLNPNIEDAHRLRGECYEAIGETKKAQEDFAIEPEHK